MIDGQCFRFHIHEKIILDEQITTDSKQIDDDHREHRCQDHGFSIADNTLDDIPQRIFTIDNIKQLAERTKTEQQ